MLENVLLVISYGCVEYSELLLVNYQNIEKDFDLFGVGDDRSKE